MCGEHNFPTLMAKVAARQQYNELKDYHKKGRQQTTGAPTAAEVVA